MPPDGGDLERFCTMSLTQVASAGMPDFSLSLYGYTQVGRSELQPAGGSSN